MTQTFLEKVAENYRLRAKSLASELHMAVDHGGVTGSHREDVWHDLLREILPRKFALIRNLVVIDSDKRQSREVDIAAIDEQYTPYVFQTKVLRVVPIEAVALVVECKSTTCDSGGLKTWCNSITDLKANRTGIARMVQGHAVGLTNDTQTRTSPIRLFAALKNVGKDFLEERLFDFYLTAADGELNVQVPNENKTLTWWSKRLNCADEEAKEEPQGLVLQRASGMRSEVPKVVDGRCTSTLAELNVKGNPLLTLNLQLNQLLMLINNPMLFPHFAYAKAFQSLSSG